MDMVAVGYIPGGTFEFGIANGAKLAPNLTISILRLPLKRTKSGVPVGPFNTIDATVISKAPTRSAPASPKFTNVGAGALGGGDGLGRSFTGGVTIGGPGGVNGDEVLPPPQFTVKHRKITGIRSWAT